MLDCGAVCGAKTARALTRPRALLYDGFEKLRWEVNNMPRDYVPAHIIRAIANAYPATQGMDIANHPIKGRGYVVYDGQGNAATFSYDEASGVVRLVSSTIPCISNGTTSQACDASSVSKAAASAPAEMESHIPDIPWKFCHSGGHGVLPGLLNLVGIFVLIGSIIFFVVNPLGGLGLAVFSVLFFWFAEVLASLRHIEAYLYSANHPERKKKP